jgi:mycothiol synthase
MAETELRPRRPADDAACAALTFERYETLGHSHDREVRDALHQVPWGTEANVMLAIEEGAPVGYAWLRNWVDLGYLEMWVADGHRRCAIGTRLLRWAIEDAKRQELPQVRCVTGTDAATAGFLVQSDFTSTPSGIRMDLATAATPEPDWPDGFVVRKVEAKTDAFVEMLWRIDQAGFADNANFGPQPLENFAHTVKRDDFDLDLAWFAFTTDGADAGFCICSHVVAQDVGVIEDIAVLPSFRRKGLARALLRQGINALRDRGATRIVLDTGEKNERAQALYRSEGFVEGFRYASWVRRL